MDDLNLYEKNDCEIESVVCTTWVFSEGTRMQYGIEKCAIIKLQWGIVKNTEGIVLPNAQVIQGVEDGGYKYLM